MVIPVINSINQLDPELLNQIKEELSIDKSVQLSWLILDNNGNAVAGTKNNVFHRQLPKALLNRLKQKKKVNTDHEAASDSIGGVNITHEWV